MSQLQNESDASIKKANIAQVAKAVFSSFLGVSKRHDNEAAQIRITLLQIIVAGLVGVAIFIGLILLLVSVVTK